MSGPDLHVFTLTFLALKNLVFPYSIVKDSSSDLGVNSKIVQIRPTVKAVSTKISKISAKLRQPAGQTQDNFNFGPSLLKF